MSSLNTYFIKLLGNGKVLIRSNASGISKVVKNLDMVKKFIEDDTKK